MMLRATQEKRLSVTVKAGIGGHKKPGFFEQDAI